MVSALREDRLLFLSRQSRPGGCGARLVGATLSSGTEPEKKKVWFRWAGQGRARAIKVTQVAPSLSLSLSSR